MFHEFIVERAYAPVFPSNFSMKIPIKISSVPKKDRIRDLPKLKKIAVSVNKMAQLNTRHLKETAYNKLKNQLDEVSMKALEAIISEKALLVST